MTLGEQADQGDLVLPEGLVIQDEIALRQERLENLAQAKAVLEARAQERYAAEKAEYEAKLREREQKAQPNKRKPGGRPPKPPQPGAQDKDQYNFTDPDSRIMKNSTDEGFDQHYNAQIAIDQASLLIVAHSLSNHPNDKHEAEPDLGRACPQVGQPEAAALDNGYFSAANITACAQRGIEPYIATGREPHHPSWQTFFAQQADPATGRRQPESQNGLQTPDGDWSRHLSLAQMHRRTGDRHHQRSAGLSPVLLTRPGRRCGEWGLVCLAFNLKRLHVLWAR